MAKVTFITEDGNSHLIEDAEGSLMDIAVDNGIEGIEGDCGGVGSCATCHVRVKQEWMEKVGKAEELEQDILEFEDGTCSRSRLCCQIDVDEDLDGLVVEVAKLG
ncbi:2Fe-2S iron-sulfur cluster-binding protein [Pelagicoccus mobilis]|uniref:2Fe-2S iron-sulfur cluster binding domain-containing protein n=1 Tax=Pelagicoccus mobilis TaxID=415221 RepID=A0A934RX98_9BACT|nr:2Fe-2S iron-sulfur cluster-binding protein [Pelagicoccus mobilis]MBK1875268.1 2Fe-2S iron-sulfur cluster binding domain-containing protein [Pelagicoccus mobilis]